MNAWGLAVAALGVFLIVIAIKGKTGQFISSL